MLTRLDNMDELVEAIKILLPVAEDCDYAAEYIDCNMPGKWWGEEGNRKWYELRQHVHDWEFLPDLPDQDTPEFDELMESSDNQAYDFLRTFDLKFPIYLWTTWLGVIDQIVLVIRWQDSSDIDGGDKLARLKEFVEDE